MASQSKGAGRSRIAPTAAAVGPAWSWKSPGRPLAMTTPTDDQHQRPSSRRTEAAPFRSSCQTLSSSALPLTFLERRANRPRPQAARTSLACAPSRSHLALQGRDGTARGHGTYPLVARSAHATCPCPRVRYFAAASLAEALYRGLADDSVGRLIEGVLRADLVVVDCVPLVVREVGPPPARAHHRGRPPRPSPAPRRDRRHERRRLPEEGSEDESGWAIDEDLRHPSRWVLLMATSGCFYVPIDTGPPGPRRPRVGLATSQP
jgi:hypothetical protein